MPTAPRSSVDEEISARNTRTGLWLFAAYLLLYAGFVLLNTFAPDLVGHAIFGISISVLYGLGLILAALALALLYAWLCRAARPTPTEEQRQ